MMRTIVLAAALIAPAAAALAHGGHAPAGPHAHGLWQLSADPGAGALVIAACAALAAAIGASVTVRRRARARRRTG